MRQYEDLLVDALLDNGFTLDEALRLIELQRRVERQRAEEQLRVLRLGTTTNPSSNRNALN